MMLDVIDKMPVYKWFIDFYWMMFVIGKRTLFVKTGQAFFAL